MHSLEQLIEENGSMMLLQLKWLIRLVRKKLLIT